MLNSHAIQHPCLYPIDVIINTEINAMTLTFLTIALNILFTLNRMVSQVTA